MGEPSILSSNRRASSLPPSLDGWRGTGCIKTAPFSSGFSSDDDSHSNASGKPVSPCLVDKLSRTHEFGIILDKMNGSALGIDIDRSDGVALLITGISSGGLVDLWNRQTPSAEVKVGDRICEVNGVRDDALKFIHLLKESQIHHIKISRLSKIARHKTVHFVSDESTAASEADEDSGSPDLLATNLTVELASAPHDESTTHDFGFTLSKIDGMSLGIEIDVSDGVSLRIDQIKKGGLVDQQNRQNPENEVKVGDRIVAINGVRNDALKLVRLSMESEVLEIKIRCGDNSSSVTPAQTPTKKCKKKKRRGSKAKNQDDSALTEHAGQSKLADANLANKGSEPSMKYSYPSLIVYASSFQPCMYNNVNLVSLIQLVPESSESCNFVYQ